MTARQKQHSTYRSPGVFFREIGSRTTSQPFEAIHDFHPGHG
jgi:hypothetical protein